MALPVCPAVGVQSERAFEKHGICTGAHEEGGRQVLAPPGRRRVVFSRTRSLTGCGPGANVQKGPYGGAFKSPVPVKGEHMKSAVTSEIVNEINYSILDDPQGRLDLADRVVRLLRTSEEDFSLVKQTSWYRGIWRAFNGNTLERVGASCQRAVQAQALVVALLKSVLRIGPDAREILALIAGEIEHIRSTFGDSAFPDSGPAGQVIELSGQSTTAPGQEIYGADLPEQTMLLILRTMIACARMDGPLAQAEVDLISRTVEAPGFSEDARSSIRSELFDPQPFQFNADGLDQYPVRYLLLQGCGCNNARLRGCPSEGKGVPGEARPGLGDKATGCPAHRT